MMQDERISRVKNRIAARGFGMLQTTDFELFLASQDAAPLDASAMRAEADLSRFPHINCQTFPTDNYPRIW